MNVVLCLLLAGVGQLEEGLCEGLWTDIPPDSPSVFNFLNAPSGKRNKYKGTTEMFTSKLGGWRAGGLDTPCLISRKINFGGLTGQARPGINE